MELQLIPKENIAALWVKLRGFIQEALEHDKDGEDSIADIYHSLVAGNLHCHVLADTEIKFAVVSSVRDTPTCRLCTVCYLGSSMQADVFLEHLPTLEGWAKANECDIMRVNGRPGWKKLLPEYEPSYEVISKRL